MNYKGNENLEYYMKERGKQEVFNNGVTSPMQMASIDSNSNANFYDTVNSELNLLGQKAISIPMVTFYHDGEDIPEYSVDKPILSQSMVTLYGDEEGTLDEMSEKAVVSEAMVEFYNESEYEDFKNINNYSVPMVEFEVGVDPKHLSDFIVQSSSLVEFEKANEKKTENLGFGLQLPDLEKQEEISIISEDQTKMIRELQEKLRITGSAIQIAEKAFNGTDFYYEDNILYNKTGERICNFILEVESETVHHFNTRNGYELRSKYIFSIYINGTCINVSVWGDEIYDLKWLRRATGGKAIIYAWGRKGNLFNELLCDCLNKSSYKEFHYYPTNGWHEMPDGSYRYLYDKGIIGMSNSDTYAAVEHKLIYDEDNVGSYQVFTDILRMMNCVCNTSAISTILVLYAHLGALTTLFDLAEFPIKFIVALIGVTNARKTSIALNLTKLFDRCVSPKPDISFEATVGGIETSFSKYHDAVFAIDDLKPSDSKEKQKETAKKLEKIVRAYGDRVPTVRMNDYSPSGKDIYYPIWGCCMITGEYLDGVASTLARIVSIHIDGNDVNNDELRYFQENYKILSTHMVDFISYITNNFDFIVSYIKSRAVEIRNEVYNIFDVPRYKESYATFLVCSEIFLGYALHRNFLNAQEAEGYKLYFERAIHRIIAASDSDIVEHNPGIIALQAIDNYIKTGIVKIYSEGQSPVLSDEYYAFIEDDYLCIKLEVAYRILLKYVRSLNADPSVTTPKQLLPFLQALDVIRIDTKGEKKRSTHKLRSRTTEIRFLFIKRNKMVEILQNENLY